MSVKKAGSPRVFIAVAPPGTLRSTDDSPSRRESHPYSFCVFFLVISKLDQSLPESVLKVGQWR